MSKPTDPSGLTHAWIVAPQVTLNMGVPQAEVPLKNAQLCTTSQPTIHHPENGGGGCSPSSNCGSTTPPVKSPPPFPLMP